MRNYAAISVFIFKLFDSMINCYNSKLIQCLSKIEYFNFESTLLIYS